MIESKVCPFCGSDEQELGTSTEDSEGVPCYLYCAECGANGPMDYYCTYPTKGVVNKEMMKALATANWNKRSVNPVLAITEKAHDYLKRAEPGKSTDILVAIHSQRVSAVGTISKWAAHIDDAIVELYEGGDSPYGEMVSTVDHVKVMFKHGFIEVKVV